MGKPTPLAKPVYSNDLPTPKFPSKYINFYYLRETGNPETEVEGYFVERHIPVKWQDMPGQLGTIIDEIRANVWPKKTSTLGGLPWQHRGFLAVVLDDQSHKLRGGDAMTFANGPLGGPYNGDNHSFRDGMDVPTVKTNISGFFCVNHMRHKHGHILKHGEKEYFWVNVNHDHSNRAARPTNARTGHEDAGTNLGPPIGGGG